MDEPGPQARRTRETRQGGWYGFRRGFTTRNSGKNTKAAMNLAGMKNLSTFNRYQQPGDAEYLSVLNNRPTSFAGSRLPGTRRPPNVPAMRHYAVPATFAVGVPEDTTPEQAAT